jgi:predicted RNase H-like nuclease (RuvC/YqgF family)
MKIQLIQGHFNANDAINILTKMIDVKIKFQEEKINSTDNEEDLKMRESRIKQLQKDLYESRKFIERQKGKINMLSEINLS